MSGLTTDSREMGMLSTVAITSFAGGPVTIGRVAGRVEAFAGVAEVSVDRVLRGVGDAGAPDSVGLSGLAPWSGDLQPAMMIVAAIVATRGNRAIFRDAYFSGDIVPFAGRKRAIVKATAKCVKETRLAAPSSRGLNRSCL